MAEDESPHCVSLSWTQGRKSGITMTENYISIWLPMHFYLSYIVLNSAYIYLKISGILSFIKKLHIWPLYDFFFLVPLPLSKMDGYMVIFCAALFQKCTQADSVFTPCCRDFQFAESTAEQSECVEPGTRPRRVYPWLIQSPSSSFCVNVEKRLGVWANNVYMKTRHLIKGCKSCFHALA